jgi:hypothetical protein
MWWFMGNSVIFCNALSRYFLHKSNWNRVSGATARLCDCHPSISLMNRDSFDEFTFGVAFNFISWRVLRRRIPWWAHGRVEGQTFAHSTVCISRSRWTRFECASLLLWIYGLAGEKLIKNQPERENATHLRAAVVGVFTSESFRIDEQPGVIRVGVICRRNLRIVQWNALPEISDSYISIPIQQNVSGFQIEVSETSGVWKSHRNNNSRNSVCTAQTVFSWWLIVCERSISSKLGQNRWILVGPVRNIPILPWVEPFSCRCVISPFVGHLPGSVSFHGLLKFKDRPTFVTRHTAAGHG